MGHLAVPTTPSRGLTEHARSHAAMQPEERWDGIGQRMHGCEWALETPACLTGVAYKIPSSTEVPLPAPWSYEAAYLAGLFAHSTVINEVSTTHILVNETTLFPALTELTIYKSASLIPSQADN